MRNAEFGIMVRASRVISICRKANSGKKAQVHVGFNQLKCIAKRYINSEFRIPNSEFNYSS